MPLSLSMEPELIHADVVARATTLARLSRRLVADGDAYGAVLAMVASDACRIQGMLWQRLMVVAPDPDQTYSNACEVIEQSLSGTELQVEPAVDCAALVNSHRLALSVGFEQSAWDNLAPTLDTLEHLMGIPEPTDSEVGSRYLARLGGSEADYAAQTRDIAAVDTAGVATAMAEAGRVDEAVTLTYQALMASFEAHVIDTAFWWGDASLGSAELLWLLGCESVARIAALPADVPAATVIVRHALASAVGTIDDRRLRERLPLS